jgi:hypothetical protein
MIKAIKKLAKKSRFIIYLHNKICFYLYNPVNHRKITQMIEKNRYRLYRKRILSQSRGNDYIAEIIRSGKPAAIGKIGTNELYAVYNFHCSQGVNVKWKDADKNRQLYYVAGIFPPKAEIFNKFSEEFLQCLSRIDLLAVWFNKGESRIIKHYAGAAKLTQLRSLEPYYHQKPWARELYGKKVLVIHPFVETIKKQYLNNCKKIWQDINVLPEFELDVIKVPLSAGIMRSNFKDWFVTLDYLKGQMANKNFDIALIGAGAWGIPLAVHAKQLGKVGYHLGGATQILFGIKGKRWDVRKDDDFGFYNTAWVRPSKEETPKTCVLVEEGVYW